MGDMLSKEFTPGARMTGGSELAESILDDSFCSAVQSSSQLLGRSRFRFLETAPGSSGGPTSSPFSKSVYSSVEETRLGKHQDIRGLCFLTLSSAPEITGTIEAWNSRSETGICLSSRCRADSDLGSVDGPG